MPDAAWPTLPQGTCSLPASLEVEVGILGAGIHGAALARELSLRGVTCALVDRGEVGGGTSQWSSQLLHGGIRYLLTGDLRQMREGLAERATWARIAPARCRWEAFWMPHGSWPEGLAHRFGIGLYDHWGSERPGWPADLVLGHVPSEVFHSDPRAAQGPFRGATAYADLMTWDRELTRDLAASSTALLLDGHDPEAFEDTSGTLRTLHLRDRRDGTLRQLAARQWVMALGPWTDGALGGWFGDSQPRLRLSAGIHLWFDAVPGCERPWAIRRPGGRILFVIPGTASCRWAPRSARWRTAGYPSLLRSGRSCLRPSRRTCPGCPGAACLCGPKSWACGPWWPLAAAPPTSAGRPCSRPTPASSTSPWCWGAS